MILIIPSQLEIFYDSMISCISLIFSPRLKVKCKRRLIFGSITYISFFIRHFLLFFCLHKYVKVNSKKCSSFDVLTEVLWSFLSWQRQAQPAKLLGSSNRQSWASTCNVRAHGAATGLPKPGGNWVAKHLKWWLWRHTQQAWGEGTVVTEQEEIWGRGESWEGTGKNRKKKSLPVFRCASVIPLLLPIPIPFFLLQRSQHRPAVAYHCWGQNCLSLFLT